MKRRIIIIIGSVVVAGAFILALNNLGNTSKIVRVGFVCAMTGAASGTGMPVANIVPYLEEVYPEVEFYVEDSKSTAAGGIQAVHKLIDVYGVNVVFCEMSNVSVAIMDYTERNKVVFLAPIILKDFVSRGKYTVRDFMTLDEQAKVDIEEYLRLTGGAGRNLVAVVSNDEFGRSSLEGVKNATEGYPIDLVASYSFDNDLDKIKGVVASILQNRPNVIFASSFSPSLGLLIKELRTSGYDGYVLTTTAFTAPTIQAAVGDGLWNIIHADFNTTVVYNDVANWYVSQYNEKPTLTTFLAYDGISIVMEAVKKAGSKDADEIIKQLEAVRIAKGAYGDLAVHDREVKFKLLAKIIGRR